MCVCVCVCVSVDHALWYVVCSDGNVFEFVIVSLDNKQWQFTAQSAEV